MSSTDAHAQPSAVETPERLDRRSVGPLAARTVGLRDRGEVLQARVSEHGSHATADQALAGIGVAVAAGTERERGVVDVQAHQPVEPDPLVQLVDELVDAAGVADIDAARPQVAGVEADGHPLGPAELVEDAGDVLQCHAHGVARAGSVLDDEPRRGLGIRLGEDTLDRGHDLVKRRLEAPAEVAAEVKDDPVGIDRLGRSERRPERLDRLGVHRVVGRSQVDEVRRVAHDGRDPRLRPCRPKPGRGVDIDLGMAPHARALREDLKGRGPDLFRPLGRLVRPAGRGEVRPEVHRLMVSATGQPDAGSAPERGVTTPASYARITACTRSRTPSFERTRATCVLTVAALTTSRSAISAFDRPRARSSSTSRSRSVSALRSGLPGSVIGRLRRNRATSRRVTDGSMSASPAAAARMPARSWSAGTPLSRNPLAPSASASKTYSSRSNVVRTTIRGACVSRTRRGMAASPSMPGMRMSRRTTSGRRRSAAAIVSPPSPASPMTRMSAWASTIMRNPVLTSSSSSASSTLIIGQIP